MCCCSKGEPGEAYNIGGPHSVTPQVLSSLVKEVEECGTNIADSSKLSKASMPSVKAANKLRWWSQKDTLKELLVCLPKVLKSKPESSRRFGEKALKFLIFGSDELITKELVKHLVEKDVKFYISKLNLEQTTDEQIVDEVDKAALSHIIMVVGSDVSEGRVVSTECSGDPSKLRVDTNKYLYIPWFLASICDKKAIHFTYLANSYLFNFDTEHPIQGPGFKEDDLPNYFGDDISIIKGYTDRTMHYFKNTLNIRMRVPFGSSQKWILKFQSSEYNNVPVSLTVLPSCLPILIDMAIKKVCGTINLANPGTISLSEVAAKYKKLVDPDFKYKTIKFEECSDCLKEEASCKMDTAKLQGMYPELKPVDVELSNYFESVLNKRDRIVNSGLQLLEMMCSKVGQMLSVYLFFIAVFWCIEAKRCNDNAQCKPLLELCQNGECKSVVNEMSGGRIRKRADEIKNADDAENMNELRVVPDELSLIGNDEQEKEQQAIDEIDFPEMEDGDDSNNDDRDGGDNGNANKEAQKVNDAPVDNDGSNFYIYFWLGWLTQQAADNNKLALEEAKREEALLAAKFTLDAPKCATDSECNGQLCQRGRCSESFGGMFVFKLLTALNIECLQIATAFLSVSWICNVECGSADIVSVLDNMYYFKKAK
uniref:Pept_C1 domain-containing protein n=1 Tax=Syphacia muris TaxID=451379 RepID=A0A0N5AFU1_9BILA